MDIILRMVRTVIINIGNSKQTIMIVLLCPIITLPSYFIRPRTQIIPINIINRTGSVEYAMVHLITCSGSTSERNRCRLCTNPMIFPVRRNSRTAPLINSRVYSPAIIASTRSITTCVWTVSRNCTLQRTCNTCRNIFIRHKLLYHNTWFLPCLFHLNQPPLKYYTLMIP